MIQISSDEVHDLKNILAVSMGMLEISTKLIDRDPQGVDTAKLREKIQKSYEALQRIEEFIRNKPRLDDPQ